MKRILPPLASRMLISFLIVYVLWSLAVDISKMGKTVDDEELVRCLFYLPPLGLLALGLIFFKVLESIAAIKVVKWFKERFHKKKI